MEYLCKIRQYIVCVCRCISDSITSLFFFSWKRNKATLTIVVSYKTVKQKKTTTLYCILQAIENNGMIMNEFKHFLTIKTKQKIRLLLLENCRNEWTGILTTLNRILFPDINSRMCICDEKIMYVASILVVLRKSHGKWCIWYMKMNLYIFKILHFSVVMRTK